MSTAAPHGGTIALDTLLAAYASGLFPMADSRDATDIYWVEPRQRAILPLRGFHLSKSLAKTVKSDRFTVTTNRDFRAVVRACAAPAPGREGTWINAIIENSYAGLHAIGHAHSVECWHAGELVGGLYGVSLGRAFFGESMFSRRTDASKVALAHLVARLICGGFDLLDCQFMTSHLASMGAQELPQAQYISLLQRALSPDGAGGAAGGRAAGAAGRAAGAAGAAAGAAFGAAAGAAGDWAALDVLAAGGAARPVSAVCASGSSASTSPGQLIVQLLTNTS
ncbi:MAG: leucyl/phenylalanyl-tRNA--protein transferase [Sphingopyxis sp.]